MLDAALAIRKGYAALEATRALFCLSLSAFPPRLLK
jgi:hypothetical protein